MINELEKPGAALGDHTAEHVGEGPPQTEKGTIQLGPGC